MQSFQSNAQHIRSRYSGSVRRFWRSYFFFWKTVFKVFWFFRFGKEEHEENEKRRQEDFYTNLGLECRNFFLSMGGVYIKLGQFLSNLSHLFPECFTATLQDMQDRVPAHPFSEIENRFLSEFGRPIREVFPSIESEPIASASTAQVHLAKYKGKKVAVKILYPRIETVIRKDLKTIRFLLKKVNRYLFRFNYAQIHKEIQELITREVDLSMEAGAIERTKKFFESEPDYVFPKVYTEVSGKSILVTEFIAGKKINQLQGVDSKSSEISRPLQLLVRAYILMIFRFREFHADPHPGNLIVTPDEKLCFIDFGAVSEVSISQVSGLRKLILRSIARDYFGVVEALDEMGIVSRKTDKERLEEIAEFTFQKLIRFLKDTDYFHNLAQTHLKSEEDFVFLKEINSSIRELMGMVDLPSNFVALQRVLALVVGNIASVDPYHTIFDYADLSFREEILPSTGVERFLLTENGELIGNTLSIPGELHRALQNLNRKRQEIRVKGLENHTDRIERVGKQFQYSLFCIASVFLSVHFYEVREEILLSISLLSSIVFGWLSLSANWKKEKN